MALYMHPLSCDRDSATPPASENVTIPTGHWVVSVDLYFTRLCKNGNRDEVYYALSAGGGYRIIGTNAADVKRYLIKYLCEGSGERRRYNLASPHPFGVIKQTWGYDHRLIVAEQLPRRSTAKWRKPQIPKPEFVRGAKGVSPRTSNL